jgi:sugar lactone lactonase YvrE
MTSTTDPVPADVFDQRLCQLGEGPLWHPLREQFFWFDILGRKLLSRDGDTPLEWQFDEHVSAAGWIDQNSLLVATETGLRRFDIASGQHEPVVAMEADDPLTRSNDGRADPQGGFWIGTMGKKPEQGMGTIYRFYKGVLEPVHSAITIPNAICFAPGGRRIYFTDTPTQRILTQELDPEGWPDSKPELFADLSEEGCRPDGAVIDAEGCLWNAQWGAARVARYRPDGSFDRAIRVGGRQSSCPAFGGPGLTRLMVTTARENIPDPGPGDGLTFIAETGIAGLPESRISL